jgi:hypothetical protein
MARHLDTTVTRDRLGLVFKRYRTHFLFHTLLCASEATKTEVLVVGLGVGALAENATLRIQHKCSVAIHTRNEALVARQVALIVVNPRNLCALRDRVVSIHFDAHTAKANRVTAHISPEYFALKDDRPANI